MKQSFHLLYQIFKKSNLIIKIKLFITIFSLFIATGFELLSIGAVIPLISVMLGPEFSDGSPTIAAMTESIGNVFGYSTIDVWVVYGFIIIILIGGITRILSLYLFHDLNKDLAHLVSIHSYRNLLNLNFQKLTSTHSSELLSTVANKVNLAMARSIKPLLQSFHALLVLISVFIFILLLNPMITLLLCLIMILVFIIFFVISKSTIDTGSTIVSRMVSLITKMVQESLQGIREILIRNSQNLFEEKFNEADLKYRKIQRTVDFLGAYPRIFLETSVIIGFSYGIILLHNIDGGLSHYVPILAAFALAAQKTLPWAQVLFVSITNIKTYSEITKEVAILFDTSNQGIVKNKPSLIEKISFNEEIILKNISFSYDQSSKHVIQNLNLNILSGDKIAIKGESGKGKSTLIDIILGLIRPSSGSVIIDDIKINNNNIQSWRSKIGYVSQDVVIFDGTIKENIIFGLQSQVLDDTDIWNVLDIVNLKKFVESLPAKLDTYVGERGSLLSGGQISRVGLARAIIGDYDLIILDETFSSLDEKNISIISDNLIKNFSYKTMIIISHSDSAYKICNKIFDIASNQMEILHNK